MASAARQPTVATWQREPLVVALAALLVTDLVVGVLAARRAWRSGSTQ
jgi:hypothetical protein